MIAGMTYYQICCYFLIYSFLGWVIEVMYHAVTLGKVVNRGFLNGPVCPVYGFGMLGILALGNTLASGDVADMPAYLMFLFGIAVATVIDLVVTVLIVRNFNREIAELDELQKQRLEAQRQKLAARLSGGRLFGAGRLLRAFPTYKNLKHGEIVERLKEQMNKPSKRQ